MFSRGETVDVQSISTWFERSLRLPPMLALMPSLWYNCLIWRQKSGISISWPITSFALPPHSQHCASREQDQHESPAKKNVFQYLDNWERKILERESKKTVIITWIPGRLTGMYPMLRPSEIGRAVTPCGIPPCTAQLKPRRWCFQDTIPDELEAQPEVAGS